MSEQRIRKLAERSGHQFHSRVIRRFRQLNWETMVSPYYLDSSTDRSREIDLVASKIVRSEDELHFRDAASLTRLFVECKYLKDPTLLWFDRKDSIAARQWVLKHTGFPKNNSDTDRHHYLLSDEVVKLFETDKKTGEHDPFFKAISQSLRALVYFRGVPTTRQDPTRRHPAHMVDYPLIVVNSFETLFRVGVGDELGAADPEPIQDNFQIEVNYAYVDRHQRAHSGYFLVDVVSLGTLETYLQHLEKLGLWVLRF